MLAIEPTRSGQFDIMTSSQTFIIKILLIVLTIIYIFYINSTHISSEENTFWPSVLYNSQTKKQSKEDKTWSSLMSVNIFYFVSFNQKYVIGGGK